jgi:hypothetical protein
MRILIHVGPGKTGSSAIQHSLLRRAPELLQHGIYYPSHILDKNGVSSGNVDAVFSTDASGSLIFSHEKASGLLEQAKHRGANTLLLSSEAFIARFEPMLAFFECVNVIFYLRNPMECAESLYNQSVKRHFNCSKITAPSEVSFSRLYKLRDTIKGKPGSELTVRLFGNQFFKGGSIVNDFLSVIAPELSPEASNKVVNPSYSFSALEFKRWFNLVPINVLHYQLDDFLQRYSKTTKKFSLYSIPQYEEFKTLTIAALAELFKNIQVESGEAFLQNVKQSEQAETFKQQLSEAQAIQLLETVNKYDKQLFVKLEQVVTSNAHPQLRESEVGKAFNYFSPKSSAIPRAWRLMFRNKRSVADRFNRLPDQSLSDEQIKGFRRRLKLTARLDNGLFLRELALFHEQIGNLEMAYYFMREARRYRPNGKLILSKLREFADQLYG